MKDGPVKHIRSHLIKHAEREKERNGTWNPVQPEMGIVNADLAQSSPAHSHSSTLKGPSFVPAHDRKSIEKKFEFSEDSDRKIA